MLNIFHVPVSSRVCLREFPALNSMKMKVKVKSFSLVPLFATPWTVAYQAPPPMGFSRREYWSGVPFPSPGNLPYPRIKPKSPASPALASELFTSSAKFQSFGK